MDEHRSLSSAGWSDVKYRTLFSRSQQEAETKQLSVFVYLDLSRSAHELATARDPTSHIITICMLPPNAEIADKQTSLIKSQQFSRGAAALTVTSGPYASSPLLSAGLSCV